jgi:DNA ligase-4
MLNVHHHQLSTQRLSHLEFWTISRLIGQTSQSARAQVIRRNSVRRPESDGEERHLALVFFDVLVLDSSSLLMQPYSARRKLLESVIIPLEGKAMIAERHAIGKSCLLGANSSQDPAARLRDVFASVLARHEEGLMLKADDGHYGAPWVKLKRDYIQGFGDAIDVCLLGAGWNKDRGRELRVGPDTFTTFYMGASSSHQTDSRPHFEGYFVAEYGLGREALEELNFLITTASPIVLSSSSLCRATAIFTDVGTVSFSGLPPGMQMPSVVLRTPLCAEVYGDRFTKDPPYLVRYTFSL